MTAPVAKSHLTFELPNLSYVDASWEEPNLRDQPHAKPKHGIIAWMGRQISTFVAWNRQHEQAAELRMMSDRELADMGLNQADVGRVFTPEFNRDLIALRGGDV